LFTLLALSPLALAADDVKLKASLVGYHPLAPKPLWVQGVRDPDGFKLKPRLIDPDTPDKFLFWKPTTVGKPLLKQGMAGQRVGNWLPLDATKVQTPGVFSLRFTNLDPDPALEKKVRINEFIYWDLLATGLRSLALQRQGVGLEDTGTGLILLPAHLRQNVQLAEGWTNFAPVANDLPSQAQADTVAGGWYTESLTYGRSTSDTALLLLAMLHTAKLEAPVLETLKLRYPPMTAKAGPAILPDLWKEALWGLQGLQSLQRPSGWLPQAVVPVGLTNQAGDKSPPNPFSSANGLPPRPHLDAATTLLLREPSASSQLLATAAWLKAATLIAKEQPELAVNWQLAANRSWKAYTSHAWATPLPPDHALLQGWVMLLFYEATADPQWLAQAHATLAPLDEVLLASVLTNPERLQWLTFLLADVARLEGQPAVATASPALHGWLSLAVKAAQLQARTFVRLAEAHPYALPAEPSAVGVPMPTLLARVGVWQALAVANPNTPASKSYRTAMTQALAYPLGFNAWDTPLVTGAQKTSGLPTLQHPCHIMSLATGVALPGLLVLGPTSDYPADVPFQDNAYQCETTATPASLQAQWLGALGAMNHLWRQEVLQVESAGATPSLSRQTLPELKP
jgi:hypothetical protein